MASRHFNAGPWHHFVDDSYSAVPARVVRVFAPAEEFEGQCGDEQVTKLLGYYVRRPRDHAERWEYDWSAA